MLTLYHAPRSRSSAIVALIEEMGLADKVAIREVGIRRTMTGTGAPDPANPHPEGKVPLLVDGSTAIRERGAIMLYLTDLFPDAGLGVPVGHPDRGSYLSWLFYYGSVVEPVLIFERAGLSHAWLHETFRGMAEMAQALARGLEGRPWLLGAHFTAADLLLASPFAWFPEATPEVPAIRDWVARCQSRPALGRVKARDDAAMAALA